ncbi:hypothetical protein BWGOE8_56100 [Bacillus mycoides]|uniref:Uncharacterized protein n=1 Tax=Bacillus mycoides TaxID=1405 RepID=A0A1E8AYR2_BACMY|nr:hypothetical protein BWGOE9_58130 [Bacillus mycoides]OFD70420.1 hypothetical protein BWGOE8_56100 [Bacillus mycoides]OFD72202.1 hypothetical protein BWGOE10_56360 [Bacillus mycoides]
MFLSECFIKDIIADKHVKYFTKVSTIVHFAMLFNFL